MQESGKIILPLDVDSAEKAVALACETRDEVAAFKIGLELINSAGVKIFDRLADEIGPDIRIFYDCKLHDIPNTVAGAARAIAKRGVWMFNIHASGGSEMMQAAVDAVAASRAARGAAPLVIAVTLLTSVSQEILSGEMGVSEPVESYVVRLARMAKETGCDGVVCSPQEIRAVRAACGPAFVIVTPGVRPADSAVGDQKRVMTPSEAALAGADYLVIGRPIGAAKDPVAAARRINEEIAQAIAKSGA